MYLSYAYFPSPSAKAMALEVGLMIKSGDDCYDWRDMMIQFQQMALACDFQSCLIAYHGHDLNAAQIHTLVKIYQTTRKLMPGILLGELIEKVSNKTELDSDQRLESAVEAMKFLQSKSA